MPYLPAMIQGVFPPSERSQLFVMLSHLCYYVLLHFTIAGCMNMAGRLLCFSLALVVLAGVRFASGQERSPALNGVDLKEMRKTIRSEDWFPEETRDPLKLVLAAQLLSDRAKENDDASEAYATLTEAITHSDLANEWHLSRSILREMESRFELPPEAIKKWYQNSIRKTEFGVRLSELADLLSTEILDEEFTDDSEAWEPIHRFLTKRLEESQNSGTQFSCRERMIRVKDRLNCFRMIKRRFGKGSLQSFDPKTSTKGLNICLTLRPKRYQIPPKHGTPRIFRSTTARIY